VNLRTEPAGLMQGRIELHHRRFASLQADLHLGRIEDQGMGFIFHRTVKVSAGCTIVYEYLLVSPDRISDGRSSLEKSEKAATVRAGAAPRIGQENSG